MTTSKLSLAYHERCVDRTRQMYRYRLQIETLASCRLRKQGCSETKMQLHQVLLRDCNQVQNEYDPARSPLAKFYNSTFEQCEGSNRVSLEASFRFLFAIALECRLALRPLIWYPNLQPSGRARMACESGGVGAFWFPNVATIETSSMACQFWLTIYHLRLLPSITNACSPSINVSIRRSTMRPGQSSPFDGMHRGPRPYRHGSIRETSNNLASVDPTALFRDFRRWDGFHSRCV